MKILYLLTQDLQSPGGGGRYFPLARALAKRGHILHLLALHSNYQQVQEKAATIDGVQIRYIGQMHVRKFAGHKEYFSTGQMLQIALKSTLQLTRKAVREEYDLVHVCKTQPMNAIPAWVHHWRRGTPVFLDADDYETLNNRYQHRWQQWVVRSFENWMPSFAEGISVTTKFLEERYLALGYPEDRILRLPHGLARPQPDAQRQESLLQQEEELRGSLAIAKDHPIVLYVGSMSLVNHALEVLIEAFSIVHDRLPEAHLIMVGGGEDLEHVKHLSQELNLHDQVHFMGHKPRDQLAAFYQMADVSVDPKRDTILAESSLSLKLLESIAAGVPCVTADTGDSKQILNKAGIAVHPGDPVAMAEGILTILMDKAIAQSMRTAALALQKGYSWESRARELEEFYRTVLVDK